MNDSKKRKAKKSPKLESSSCSKVQFDDVIVKNDIVLDGNLNNDENDDDDDVEQPLVPYGMLPSYMADAFSELYEEDGLICLGKGLQWLMLLASFIRYYTSELSDNDCNENDDLESNKKKCANNNNNNKQSSTIKQRPLILVLGLKDEIERNTLIEILQSWGTPLCELPTMITSSSDVKLSKDRSQLYSTGGCYVVTSQILIVDLLTNVIQSNNIHGILIAHAENVTEQSTEAFILRIYHSQRNSNNNNCIENNDNDNTNNNTGFVKAFTDAPEALISGFAKIDKILKALHVRKLYLYPRFHTLIRDELENTSNITVTEYQQELTKLQKDIQNTIAVLIVQCLRQLKNSTRHFITWNNIENNNSDDIKIENCITKQFDRIISKQLEPYWYRLSPSTKQLVQDLRTLRTLFHTLLQYDCVNFYKLLTSIRTMSAASKHAPSMWLLEPITDTLFRKAKERVYKIIKSPHNNNNKVSKLQAILEENPKWKLLENVLQEIKVEYDKEMEEEKSNSTTTTTATRTNNIILVMVKDCNTLETIKDYLSDDVIKPLQKRWLRYLSHINDEKRSLSTSLLSEESRLLIEEEGRIRRILSNNKKRNNNNKEQEKKQKKILNQIPAYVRKRRRIALEKGRGEKTDEDLQRQAILDEAVEVTEHEINMEKEEENDDIMQGNNEEDEVEAIFNISYPVNELQVQIQCYTNCENDRAHLLLQDIRPKYIILYDVEIYFIRAVEIYASLLQSQQNIRVYFLIFEASAEEKNFKKQLEREQNAFEKLIQHKITMPQPTIIQTLDTQEMQQALHNNNSNNAVAGTYMNGTLPLAVDTRRGNKKTTERRDIAVDVREFRSVLPNILHQGGMRLAPVTLTVGDFVLSSVHCIERKSISDLFGSFTSGRLYTQVEAMSKYYKCPCLLIEFDPNKSFCLQNVNELGVEIKNDSVCSKMVLLTLHFPKLRILWSRSPHETLKIFRELKRNHEEVDVERAIEIGRTESEDYLLQPDGEEDEINEAARDMLLRLPGVNVHSARRIMQECDSLAELAEMSRDELRRIAGPVTGQKLFTFFRQKMAGT